MITFKQFLTSSFVVEKAVGAEPSFQKLSADEAKQMFLKHGSEAFWMIKENKPLWRGIGKNIFHGASFLTVDTTSTERRSQNTSNHYTAIFDNHPEMENFPKRSRSFICTTNMATASEFSISGSLCVVLPLNRSRIGAVHKDDLWDVHIHLFGGHYSVDEANEWIFRSLGIKDNIWSIKEFGENLKDEHSIEAGAFIRAFGEHMYSKVKDNFLDQVLDAYSPAKTGFTLHSPATLKGVKGEVWVGGDVLLIEDRAWEAFRKDMLESAIGHSIAEAKDEKLHSGTKNGRRAYKDYTNFKGVSAEEKRELKKEMDRELKKFKDSDHRDPKSYPKINGKTDWPADKKYREKLKKRGKKIPKSDSTIAYQRMYGDKK